MDNTIFKAVENGNYSDFSNAVKTELKQKLANSEVIKDYSSDYQKIQDMKDTFSQITTKYDN